MNYDKQQSAPRVPDPLQHIVWSDAFATGIPLIDDQHKILINIVNDIRLGLTGRYNRIALQHIMLELKGYILYHFGAEEQLMAQHGFDSSHPDEQASHLRQHQDFSTWLDELERDIRRNRRVSLEALFAYLRDWLLSHIIHTDKHLADFLVAGTGSQDQLRSVDGPTTLQTLPPAPAARTGSPGHSHSLLPAG
jgi:hemerythrin